MFWKRTVFSVVSQLIEWPNICAFSWMKLNENAHTHECSWIVFMKIAATIVEKPDLSKQKLGDDISQLQTFWNDDQLCYVGIYLSKFFNRTNEKQMLIREFICVYFIIWYYFIMLHIFFLHKNNTVLNGWNKLLEKYKNTQTIK